MSSRSKARITGRKQPKQARSEALVASILEAAVRVLAEEGAPRFTTARVAERAGVSVGSLYQYFPNKASILFRLQSDEWKATTEKWRTILGDRDRPPLNRLRDLVHAFLHSEVEEAAVRVALDDAAPLYRDAAEAQQLREQGDQVVESFMAEAFPDATLAKRQLVGDLLVMTLTSVGKEISETAQRIAKIDAYAEAMSDMFDAYLRNQQCDRSASVAATSTEMESEISDAINVRAGSVVGST